MDALTRERLGQVWLPWFVAKDDSTRVIDQSEIRQKQLGRFDEHSGAPAPGAHGFDGRCAEGDQNDGADRDHEAVARVVAPGLRLRKRRAGDRGQPPPDVGFGNARSAASSRFTGVRPWKTP